MRWEAPVILLLIALPLAGCVSSPDLEAASQDANRSEVESSPLLQKLDAQPPTPNATVAVNAAAAAQNVSGSLPMGEPWWVVRVNATPEGGLAGTRWTIPEGALVPWGLNDVYKTDDQVVPLEIALIIPEGKGSAVTAWGLLGFQRSEEGGLEPGGGHVVVAQELTTGDASPKKLAASLKPTFEHLSDVKEGDEYPFVAVAVTNEPMEVGVAFRVLPRDFTHEEGDDEPVESTAAFLGARTTRPIALPTTPGSGFAAHAYTEIRSDGFPFGNLYFAVQRVGKVEERIATPPEARALGGPWSGSLLTASSFPRGYAYATMSYVDFGTGATKWAATIEGRGKAIEGSGVEASAMPTFFLPTPTLVYASGGAAYAGDGDGKLAATFSVDAPGRPGLIQVVSIAQVEMGATLQHLVGQPAATYGYSTDELPIPVARAVDGRIVPLTLEESLFPSWRAR